MIVDAVRFQSNSFRLVAVGYRGPQCSVGSSVEWHSGKVKNNIDSLVDSVVDSSSQRDK